MAILHLGANRVQGQTGGQGWVATQTGSSSSPYMYIDKTNGNLAFQLGNNTTSASASYDLTSTSDTQWTMRVKLVCSDVQNDGSIAFQMQSVENCATSANADRIGFFLYNNGGTWNIVDYDDSYTDRFWTDGSAWAGSQTFNSTGISSSNTTLYVEVKRTSATAGQVSVTTNSDYTTSASTKSIGSLPSSVAGLRYLSLQNRTTGSHTDKLTGTIADIKFWNATNDTTATPTYTATSNTFKDDKATLITDATSFTAPSFDQYLDYSSYDARPHDVQLKSDGTKMYVMDYVGREIRQFSLSTAYDISTASSDGTLDVSSEDISPTGLFIDSSGSHLFITGRNQNNVDQFSLGTAWDITTGVSHVRTNSTSWGNLWGLTFNPDGTKMYVMDNGVVKQYDLGSAWNITTLSNDTEFDPDTQDNNAFDAEWNDDGTALYITGHENDSIYKYTCSTAYSIASSSISYDSVYFAFPTDYHNSSGFCFAKSGQKMYVSTGEATYDRILEYDIGSPASSDLEENTIFIEKDTKRYYWLQDNAWKPVYAGFTEDFSEATPTTWAEDSSSGYANNLEPYKGSVNRLWFDLDYDSSIKTSGSLDLANSSLLGSNLNNNKWIMRFKLYIDSASNNHGTAWIGFSDSAGTSDDTQRFAGCRMKYSSGLSCGSDNSGQALTSGNRTDGGTTTLSDNTDYYITVERQTANKLVVTTRTGSHTGTLVATTSATTLETATDDLRYWKIMNHRAGSSDGTLKGYLYDLEIWDNTDIGDI